MSGTGMNVIALNNKSYSSLYTTKYIPKGYSDAIIMGEDRAFLTHNTSITNALTATKDRFLFIGIDPRDDESITAHTIASIQDVETLYSNTLLQHLNHMLVYPCGGSDIHLIQFITDYGALPRL